MAASITVGNRDLVWAKVFQSDGLWHFNIHRVGESFAVFGSNYKDGHSELQAAIDHATDLIKKYEKG